MAGEAIFAAGGLGGSGTRVVAQVFDRLGFYLGPRLNGAGDCLLFTLLFKRPAWMRDFPPETELARTAGLFLRALTEGAGAQLQALGAAELEALKAPIAGHRPPIGVTEADIDALCRTGPPPLHAHAGIAWKEPNTHIFLPALDRAVAGLRYVHVIRHGLDMALSHNQAQLANWGRLLGIVPAPGEPPERTRLRFWLTANRRAIAYGRERMGERFLLLDYDALCRDPAQEIARLARFCGRDLPPAVRAELCDGVRPAPRHRYLDAAPGLFDEGDRAAVRALGFGVEQT